MPEPVAQPRGGPAAQPRGGPAAQRGDGPATQPGQILAAGVIVWRRGPDGPEVLLIHRPRRDDWSLAKGKRDPGEQLPQTAIREVAEETGIRPVLGRRLRTVRYLAAGHPAGAPPVPVSPVPP